MIINGHALDVLKRIPTGSVHCGITSSPYYGLRNYGTPPIVWGGDPNCDHDWTEVHPPGHRGSDTNPGPLQHAGNKNREKLTSNFCGKCGAWRGELGLEPSPELFIEHLTEIYREFRRVLRDDGVFWANIGDSYTSTSCGSFNGGSNIFTGRDMSGHSKSGDVNKLKASGLKEKDLMEIPSLLAASLRADGWYLRSRIPWIKRNCVAQQTVLYVKSQKGAMPMSVDDMSNLRIGTFSLWNGKKWTKVVDLTPLPSLKKGMEVEFRDGYKICVTEEHRWPIVGKGLVTTCDLRVGDVVQKTTLPDEKHIDCGFLPDDLGRIIGLFISEGSYLNLDHDDAGIQFTFSESETHLDEEIKKFAIDYGGSHHSHSYDTGGKIMSIVHGKIPISIIRHFTENKGSKNLRIANTCWKRSNVFLSGLLDGYLEGDGHFDSKNNRWRLGFCKNYNLAMDIRMLCARLGYSVRIKRGVCTATKGGKEHDIWRGQIRKETPDKSINGGCFKITCDSEIVSVKPSNRDHKYYNIGVEDDPHLFALGNGVLTHNSLPSSVTDRPSTSIEYVFMLTKSGDTTFWTHPSRSGMRSRPEPDHIFINGFTHQVEINAPENWKDLLFIDPESGKEKKLWRRKNLWSGHDYFYDYVATMQPSSESYNKDKRPRGVLRQCVNAESKYPDSGQFKKQDNVGSNVYTGFNDRYIPNEFGLRFMRDSDFFFRTWQGLLHNEDGEPMTLVVNPKGYKGAHFACFAPRLVEPMVLASTSGHGVCSECGAPWHRVIRKRYIGDTKDIRGDNHRDGTGQNDNNYLALPPGEAKCDVETLGWLPTCSCNADIAPATVIDMFNGSGSTGVAAEAHGRRYIGIELNPEYCDLAMKRLKEGK